MEECYYVVEQILDEFSLFLEFGVIKELCHFWKFFPYVVEKILEISHFYTQFWSFLGIIDRKSRIWEERFH